MSDRYWFRQKDRGYGAAPKDWRGWMLVLGFGVVQTALALVMLWPDFEATPMEAIWQMVYWLIVSLVLTAGFLWLVWRMTEGGWRWRSLFGPKDGR